LPTEVSFSTSRRSCSARVWWPAVVPRIRQSWSRSTRERGPRCH